MTLSGLSLAAAEFIPRDPPSPTDSAASASSPQLESNGAGLCAAPPLAPAPSRATLALDLAIKRAASAPPGPAAQESASAACEDGEHGELIASLLQRSQAITPNKLWSFLKRVKLSRPVSEPGNFADGLLFAELIHLYAPLLVTAADLHRIRWEHTRFPAQRRAWRHLARVALPQLRVLLTVETVEAFERGDASGIADALIVVLQQIDQHTRIAKAFHAGTRAAIANARDRLAAPRQLRGATLFAADDVAVPRVWAAPSGAGKAVVRLSNVDYQTTRAEVVSFLYPLIVDEACVHVPINLATGRVVYMVYVLLDDGVLPLRAVDMHSGHALRGRRVEIKVVPLDEMLGAFFARGMGPRAVAAAAAAVSSGASAAGLPSEDAAADEPEWIPESLKLALLHACAVPAASNVSPATAAALARAFEHVLSFLRVLPAGQPGVRLSPAERKHVFDVAVGACMSLAAAYSSLPHMLTASAAGKPAVLALDELLLDKIIEAALALPNVLAHDQVQVLEAIRGAHSAGVRSLAQPVGVNRVAAPMQLNRASTPRPSPSPLSLGCGSPSSAQSGASMPQSGLLARRMLAKGGALTIAVPKPSSPLSTSSSDSSSASSYPPRPHTAALAPPSQYTSSPNAPAAHANHAAWSADMAGPRTAPLAPPPGFGHLQPQPAAPLARSQTPSLASRPSSFYSTQHAAPQYAAPGPSVLDHAFFAATPTTAAFPWPARPPSPGGASDSGVSAGSSPLGFGAGLTGPALAAANAAEGGEHAICMADAAIALGRDLFSELL